ncbi:glycoside hydrolase family 32 protein [Celerinatantimonas diazotrophica]|uniref:Sucrose-6-phosphate hydrolase n=1 Tax=Celerinatantimonas diazotrophica TaxID=412034 RepID=A0A4V2PNL4_9GAMM|nr:sucrose-6-phosphate hydrolase [Celerinatantimonas diazotrophica]TCK47571.1 beta-fructofuranosidase [Celerinatantimonas diazotrophica]CAG9296806.1 Sucrose-6-phosphate hydrolase [Celerinatantimonas diazotrophica]
MSINSESDNHKGPFSWRPSYHIAPPYGLMNDPNGFSYFNHQYWLFFQWNPSGCEHVNKHWGLMTSTDLVHWQQQPFKMAPTHWFDKDGCYSGSGLVEKGGLSLFYTGNVRHGELRESYQCLVTTEDGQQYLNQGPLWTKQLEDFTGHVRDPKVFYVNQQRRMWLAAQNRDLKGGVAVLDETAEGTWQLRGHYFNPIGWANDQLGYMWECPDRLQFGDQVVLVCCVQGINCSDPYSSNENLSGFFQIEEDADGEIRFTSDYLLLDHGFEFYAPQSIVDPQGQTILIGWMGLPDDPEQPSVANEQWCGQLTMPRVCQWENGALRQRPLAELFAAFSEPNTVLPITFKMASFECTNTCYIELDNLKGAGQLTVDNPKESLVITWDENGEATVDRTEFCTVGMDLIRQYKSRDGCIKQLQLFIDNSSFELFINDGEAVMTGRIFPNTSVTHATVLGVAGELKVRFLDTSCINTLMKEQFSDEYASLVSR